MSKKKYVMKEDASYYEELSTEYDRQQMADYSFKKRTDIEGRNVARLRRNRVIKVIFSVIGAFVIMSIGYFSVAVVRNSNEYHPVSTTTTTTQPQTTYPETQEETTQAQAEETTGQVTEQELSEATQ